MIRTDSPRPKFKRPPSMTPSPQKATGSKKLVRRESPTSFSPTIDSAPKFQKVEEDSDVSLEKESRKFMHPATASASKAGRRHRNSKRQYSSEEIEDEIPQKPIFKTPYLDDIDDLGTLQDLAKNLPSTQALDKLVADQKALESDSSLSDVVLDDLDDELFNAPTARCPMCREPVDAGLLKQHTLHGRMNIKKQTAFCREHKRKTARDTRLAKGYPEIDWDSLESRLRRQEELLDGILKGTHSSHYADQLEKRVAAGQNRTLLKTDDSLTPGYYGPRGLRAMTDFITRTFSDTIRKRAIEDRLVSARGYSGYVQTVLVPELAVRLIMEDMRVTEEDAREIMHDSRQLGEFLHDEKRDIVTRGSDDED
jgi:hypothetical protein